MKEIEERFRVQPILDTLCQYERSCGRHSLLILKIDGIGTIRALDGVQVFVPEEYSDVEVLDMFDTLKQS